MRSSSKLDRKAAAPVVSQVQRCYEILREWIVACDLAPGARLTERELMARTGFGRTPVREALMRLAHDGLVTTLPRSGYEVTPLTEQKINDLYDIWRLLGPLIARLAYSRITVQRRDQLAALEEARPGQGADPVAMVLWNSQYFDILAQATENEQLIFLYHRLGGEMARLFVMFLGSELGEKWMPRPGQIRQLAYSTDPDQAVAYTNDAIRVSHEGILSSFRALAQRAASSTPSRQ